MKVISIILVLLLCLTSYIGDYIVFKSRYSESLAYRAVTDNLVHSVIGFLSAVLFFQSVDVTRQAWLYNVVFCTTVSSLIDVDHFILAKSIYLKDLTNLKHRGFLHNTTFWLLITLILFLYSNLYRKINIYVLTFMLKLAYTSHHIRDANRRGIWFYPFGSTPPIPKFLYTLLVAILPVMLTYVFHYFKPMNKTTVLNYNALV